MRFGSSEDGVDERRERRFRGGAIFPGRGGDGDVQERANDAGERVARETERVARRERERRGDDGDVDPRFVRLRALRGGDDERGASRGVVRARGSVSLGRPRDVERVAARSGLARWWIVARGERGGGGERLDARLGHVRGPRLGGSGECAARDEFARGAERGLAHRGFARGARERERSGRRARQLGRGDARVGDRVEERAARVLQRVGLVEGPRRLAEHALHRGLHRGAERGVRARVRATRILRR